MRFFTKAISLLIIHGPKVSISKSTSRGPSKVEIRVVNQGDVETKTQTILVEPHVLVNVGLVPLLLWP